MGAIVASVSAVVLVFVVLHFGATDVKPLPIVQNPTAPSAPPPMMDIAQAMASAKVPPTMATR